MRKPRRCPQQAEVYHVRHRDEPVLFEANRVKLVETRETSGVALRIIKDGRTGLSSTSDFDNIDSLIGNTLEMVSFGPGARLEFAPHHSFSPVEVYDPETESVSLQNMIDLGQTAIDRLRGTSPDLVCDAGVAKGVTTVTILNTRGGAATYTKSGFSVFVSGAIVRDDDMLFVSDGESSCRPILGYARDRRIYPEPAGAIQKRGASPTWPGPSGIYAEGV